MDDKSLEKLEFPRIREMLAGFTSFPASREMALSLQPRSNCEEVSLLLRQSAEARYLLNVNPGFRIAGVHDIKRAVNMAAHGKLLEPGTLMEVQETIHALRQVRSTIRELPEELPLLWEIASGIVEFPRLEKDIVRCIGPLGEVVDSASRGLAVVRQRAKEVRERLLAHLNSMIGSSRWRQVIQEPVVSQREGRYVILVKVESKKAIKGIIHDTSNTGATVYLEPWSAVEMGNDLRECLAEERREVERILMDLSAEVGRHGVEISRSLELAAELDLVLAKARYSLDANAAEPSLTAWGEGDEGDVKEGAGVLKLIEARHPLLGKKGVPLSVEIGRDFSILVITGPNTGGKTVALKTIGLLSLMAQAGIPVPASGESCFPVFDNIFCDIGDDQSIEETLSTFSWHMGNIVRIIEHATPRSLVLLDELGTSTDPVEGSALARSVLLYFLSRGTMIVATTHFSDLKVFAYTRAGMQNASFAFDPMTLAPTYHLTMGVPGGSNALATASRLGLPDEIISDARGMLSKGEQDLEDLIASMTGEKERAEALRREMEREKDRIGELKREVEEELRSLRMEEREFLQGARDDVISEAARLQKEIRHAAVELRREKSERRIEKAKEMLDIVNQRLSDDLWQPQDPGLGEEVGEKRISVGDRVCLRGSDLQATVLSLSEKQDRAEVQIGQVRLWLGLASVEKASPLPDGEPSQGVSMRRKTTQRPLPLELDLRGRRAEEVEVELDRYLNDAFLSNLREVRIVHGFGTGTVRQITRDFLTSHSLVKSFRPGDKSEGGDGVTVIVL